MPTPCPARIRLAGCGTGGITSQMRRAMLSQRDARALADIEKHLRAGDPDLVEWVELSHRAAQPGLHGLPMVVRGGRPRSNPRSGARTAHPPSTRARWTRTDRAASNGLTPWPIRPSSPRSGSWSRPPKSAAARFAGTAGIRRCRRHSGTSIIAWDCQATRQPGKGAAEFRTGHGRQACDRHG